MNRAALQPMDFDPAKWADRPDPAIGIMHCIDQVGYLQRFLVSWADRHNEQLPAELLNLNELQRLLARVGMAAQERWMVRPGVLPRAEQTVSDLLRGADEHAERKRIEAERIAKPVTLDEELTQLDAERRARFEREEGKCCAGTRVSVIRRNGVAASVYSTGKVFTVLVEEEDEYGQPLDSKTPFATREAALSWANAWVAQYRGGAK